MPIVDAQGISIHRTALVTGALGDIVDVAAWLTDDERAAVRRLLWASPQQGDAAEWLASQVFPHVTTHVRLWPDRRPFCLDGPGVAAQLASEGRELPACADWSSGRIFREAVPNFFRDIRFLPLVDVQLPTEPGDVEVRFDHDVVTGQALGLPGDAPTRTTWHECPFVGPRLDELLEKLTV